MKKNIIVFILIAIVAIVVIIFVSVANKKPSEVSPVEVPAEVTEEIAGWQMYRNEELGFEVQYPEGWFTRDYQKNNPKLKNSPRIGFDPWESNPGGSIWSVSRSNATDTSSEQLVKILATTSDDERYDVEKREILYGGYSAIEIISRHIERNIITLSVVIPRGQYVYSIRAEDYSASNINPEEMSWPYKEKLVLLKQLGEDYPKIFLKSFRFID